MSEAKLIAGTFQGENNPKAKKVICIETNQIFNTIKEASEVMHINRDGISKTCRGIQKKQEDIIENITINLINGIY